MRPGVTHAQIQHPSPSFLGDCTAVQLAVRASAGRAPERAEATSVAANQRAGDGGQSLSNHGYAAAAIRLSRTYW